eukprot:TRINITY_DN80479_c0_g1_i1.p1 TRINITY_DN80479_c0_g1~~TRINITY_DN80479_c0_g1_i1.p1  ORF type:complete len:161 (-),score=37.26 TRINITY_DN80479_c0_g1_i1:345-827(-)
MDHAIGSFLRMVHDLFRPQEKSATKKIVTALSTLTLVELLLAYQMDKSISLFTFRVVESIFLVVQSGNNARGGRLGNSASMWGFFILFLNAPFVLFHTFYSSHSTIFMDFFDHGLRYTPSEMIACDIAIMICTFGVVRLKQSEPWRGEAVDAGNDEAEEV